MRILRDQASQLALVMLVALVVRVAFVAWWQQTHLDSPQQFEFPDSVGYWELGHHLAAGEPYEFGSPDRCVFRGPGYPLLLAAMFQVMGADASPASARILGCVIGTLTVGAVYWLARPIFDRSVALLAAGMAAVYPEAIATSGWPLSDGPFCLWMMLQLILWRAAALEINANSGLKRRMWLAFLAGILGGLAALTRPSWLLFTPLVLAVWVIGCRFRRDQLTLALVTLLGLAITMWPWWIRNWYVIGKFVPTTLVVGASLYDGLNPHADGSSDMQFVPQFQADLRAADVANPPPPSAPPFEYRLNRRFRDAAFEWAAAHPGRTIQLAAIKFLRTWNVWPNEPAFRSWWLRLIVAATYTPIVLLAIVGGWLMRRRSFAVLLLVSPAMYFTLLHVVFVGSLRYRQPAMLTLTILAAAAIVEIWHSLAAATPKSELAPAIRRGSLRFSAV